MSKFKDPGKISKDVTEVRFTSLSGEKLELWKKEQGKDKWSSESWNRLAELNISQWSGLLKALRDYDSDAPTHR